MFSGLLLYVPVVEIVLAVTAIVTAAATITATAIQKEKDRKAARNLEREKKEYELEGKWYDRASYEIAVEKNRKLEFTRYNLNNLQEWYKYKLALKTYTADLDFNVKCVDAYEVSGTVPELCRAKGVTEETIENTRAENQYNEEVAHYNKMKITALLAIFLIAIILLTMYKDEVKILIK